MEALIFEEQFKRKIFFGLICSIGVVGFLYVYLVNQTVMNIVERKSSEEKLSELSSKLNALEFSYINLEGNITLEKAEAMGLSDRKDKIFVTWKPLGRTLSLSNEI